MVKSLFIAAAIAFVAIKAVGMVQNTKPQLENHKQKVENAINRAVNLHE